MLFADLQTSRSRQLIAFLLFMGLVVLIALRVQGIFDENNFHEEFRILYHFDPNRLSAKDYSGQFLSQFPQPFLYRSLTRAALSVGLSLEQFHRLLGAACYLLFIAGIVVAVLRFGTLTALAVSALVAVQVIVVEQIGSATPHAFAFPLLAWMLASLLHDRPYGGAALTVIASLLYIPVVPVMGLMFAAHLVVLRRGLARTSHLRWANLACLAATAIVTLVLVAEQLQTVEAYGAPLVPGERIEEFPENGPNGRYHSSVFEPVTHVVSVALGQFNTAMPPPVVFLLFLLASALSGIGFYSLRSFPKLYQPVVVFVVPSIFVFGLVLLFRPHVSYRFALYPAFTIAPLLFVCGLQYVLLATGRFERWSFAGYLSVLALFLIGFGATSDHGKNRGFDLTAGDREVLEWVAKTSPDSLIVAWPNQTTPSLIPYVSGRPLLVDYKAHYPNYEGYLLGMRTRMYDLIDAYYATTFPELAVLRCRWDAEYLVLNTSSLSETGDHLTYFAPYDLRISKKRTATAGQGRILASPPQQSVVFQSGRYTVIDLDYFSSLSGCDEMIPQR